MPAEPSKRRGDHLQLRLPHLTPTLLALATDDSSTGELFFGCLFKLNGAYLFFGYSTGYWRQQYVGWSIRARAGIEFESSAGVCGRGRFVPHRAF